MMNNKTLIIGIFLFGLISCGQRNTKSNNEQATDSVVNENSVSNTLNTDILAFNNTKAIEMLREFYAEYNALDLDTTNISYRYNKWVDKYTTSNIEKQVEDTGIDFEFLIQGQGLHEENFSTLSINLDSIGTNNFCVKYECWDKTLIKVRYHIVKDENNYKIDKVLR